MREQIAYPPVKRRASAEQVQRRKPDLSSDVEEEEVPDSYYNTRMPTSARRYTTTNGQQVITQGNRRIVIHNEPPPKPRHHFHWLFWVGLSMFLLFGGWWALGQVETWWANQQNTWSYGYPRTFQTDIVAFKDDTPETPTHVIALNLNGKIETIIFPHGDASHAKIYIGPTIYSDNPSLVPVTVSFKDVDGSGRLSMLLHVGDQTIIYLNDGSQFQSPKQ